MAKELLPGSIHDKRFETLAELLNRFDNLPVEKLLIYLIDYIDDEVVLDLLAWQFHVEGYELVRNLEEKRKLVKIAIELHRYKGTRWVIQEALKLLNLKGEIKEWFEYGGNPYYFLIEIELNRPISIELRKKLITFINEYKNVRSFLEDLILFYRSKNHLTPSCGNIAEGYTFSKLKRELDHQTSTRFLSYSGCLAETQTNTEIIRTYTHESKTIRTAIASLTSETQVNTEMIRTYTHKTQALFDAFTGISSEVHINALYTHTVFDKVSCQVYSALGTMSEIWGNTLYGGW